jgi:streptomycin 6-kinase
MARWDSRAATRVLCTAAHDLHTVGTGDGDRSPDLVPLDRWFRDLFASAGAHRGFVRRAAETARSLLDERRDEVVLHGDVHHANGLCNPTHGVALLPGRRERQVGVAADAAGLAAERLLRWVVAWTGLSAVWFSGAGPGWMSSAARDGSTASALATGRTAEDLLR